VSRLRYALPWGVAVAILAILLVRVDRAATLAALRAADLAGYAPIAVLFTGVWLALDAFVLRRVFARAGARLSFPAMALARARTYPWLVISFDLGSVALVAGLRRATGAPLASLAAAMITHYACDLVALATIAAAASLAGDGALAGALRPLLCALALAALAALFGARLGVSRLRDTRLAAALRAFRARDLARIVALRWVFYASFAVFVWLTLPCFGLRASFLDVLARMPLVQSIAALPIAPSGLGTAQAAMVAAFAGLGPSSSWLAYALVYGLTLVALRLPVGFAAWGRRLELAS
jgi:uncharacterized membrane protein YbhN (UPF0104 family)